MKTISMWAYSGGNREIGIHDVEAELFEKLRPAFDEMESQPEEGVGRIIFDEDTSLLLFRKLDDGKKEASNGSTVEGGKGERQVCRTE